MGIWDRLGNLIKSYISNDDESVFGEKSSQRRSDPEWKSRDSDLDAAYEELDDFLRGNSGNAKAGKSDDKKTSTWKRPMPEDIKKAFVELGLTLEAGVEECKEAYKKLLKTHHPDHHSKHEENLKNATDRTTKINAAYERLMEWFRK